MLLVVLNLSHTVFPSPLHLQQSICIIPPPSRYLSSLCSYCHIFLILNYFNQCRNPLSAAQREVWSREEDLPEHIWASPGDLATVLEQWVPQSPWTIHTKHTSLNKAPVLRAQWVRGANEGLKGSFECKWSRYANVLVALASSRLFYQHAFLSVRS